jgi:hypothetical protein
MNKNNLKECLDNFMGAIDTPVGRRKYGSDRFLMDCVQFAKDRGYNNPTADLESEYEASLANVFIDEVMKLPDGSKVSLCDDTLKAIAVILRKAMPK